MMTVTACIAVMVIIMAMGWLWYLAVNAPLGWEDENGWHDGRPD